MHNKFVVTFSHFVCLFWLLVSNSLQITLFLFTKMKSVASFLFLLAVVSSHDIQNAEQQHHNSTERSVPKKRLLSILGLGILGLCGKDSAFKNLSKDRKPVIFTTTTACILKILNENAINVLPQLPNMATYMILNPEKGHWLFTSELSGCDIFVATKPSQPKIPLIVHANFDRLNLPVQQVENLRLKGKNVDKILGLSSKWVTS